MAINERPPSHFIHDIALCFRGRRCAQANNICRKLDEFILFDYCELESKKNLTLGTLNYNKNKPPSLLFLVVCSLGFTFAILKVKLLKNQAIARSIKIRICICFASGTGRKTAWWRSTLWRTLRGSICFPHILHINAQSCRPEGEGVGWWGRRCWRWVLYSPAPYHE